jgi:hypothetical protein
LAKVFACNHTPSVSQENLEQNWHFSWRNQEYQCSNHPISSKASVVKELLGQSWHVVANSQKQATYRPSHKAQWKTHLSMNRLQSPNALVAASAFNVLSQLLNGTKPLQLSVERTDHILVEGILQVQGSS